MKPADVLGSKSYCIFPHNEVLTKESGSLSSVSIKIGQKKKMFASYWQLCLSLRDYRDFFCTSGNDSSWLLEVETL